MVLASERDGRMEKDQDRPASLETVKPLVNCLKALRSWTECVESSVLATFLTPFVLPSGDFAEQKPPGSSIKVCLKFPRRREANCF